MGEAKVMLNAADVGRLIGQDPHHVRLMARQGKLPYVKEGSAVRFPRPAIDQWLKEQSETAIRNMEK